MFEGPGTGEATAGWLRLLVEEASPEQFAEHLRKTLERAEPVDREAALALAADAEQIRLHLVARKQANDELAVLNDLARRLAALRDSAGVLQEVTSQARRLLAADIAYIMLLQPDGTLRIDFVDGSLGLTMSGIRLSPGAGLGGQVLSTGRPAWSRSYLEDSALAHVDAVDDAAASEQLGGILGVPLMLAGDTIGVLFAADRRPRDFAGREVVLLSALASHAAVAIRNAELFEANERALADLREATRTRERAAELREDLTELVIGGGGVEEVTDALSRALGCAVTLHRHEDAPVHAVGRTGVPVRLRSGYAGSLVADIADDPEVRLLLPIGAAAVALVLVSEHALAEADQRSRTDLVSALLAPDVDPASTRRRARTAGLDVDRMSTVVVVDPSAGHHEDARRSAGLVAAAVEGWTADHLDHAVVLVPRLDVDEVVARIRSLPGRSAACTIGAAPSSGGVAGVRQAHSDARNTAALLRSLGRSNACAAASDLAMYRSLFNQAGREEVQRFVEDTVGPLLSHDVRHSKDLAATLLTYLQQARHHGRTCTQLNIHANTLYQRLVRITELLGEGWREPDRALELQMALRMDQLIRQVGPVSAARGSGGH